jgi:hypothetical protein
MRYYKIITIVIMSLGFLSLLSTNLPGQEVQSPGFVLAGPPETASLEKELDKRLGGYAWGIWPRTEIIKSALLGKELPEQYIKRIREWLPIVIKKEYLPDKIDPNQFYGLPRLHGAGDFIIGELSNLKQDAVIQFQANGLGMVFTVTSEKYFPNDVNGISDAEIIQEITGLLNYPEDQIKSIKIDKKIEAMGDVDKKIIVCYGKLRSGGYDESKAPFRTPQGKMENVPTWWNHMAFWIAKGKIFFSTTMVNWENSPSTLDPYVFKLNSSK